MKTFLSVLGGLTMVGVLAGGIAACIAFPHVVAFTLLGLCLLAMSVMLFYLGYTFVRDVILGG